MANNRMWLKCTKCKENNEILLSKYFPDDNWFVYSGTEGIESRLNDFFEEHRHIEDPRYNIMDGMCNFKLEYEEPDDT